MPRASEVPDPVADPACANGHSDQFEDVKRQGERPGQDPSGGTDSKQYHQHEEQGARWAVMTSTVARQGRRGGPACPGDRRGGLGRRDFHLAVT